MKTLVLILAAGPMGDEHYGGHGWRHETPRHLLPIAGEFHIRRDLRLVRRFGFDAVVVTKAEHIKAVIKNTFEPEKDYLLWDTMLSTRKLWDSADRVVFIQGDQLLYEDFLGKVFETWESCTWEADHGPPAVIFMKEDYDEFENALKHLKDIQALYQDCMQNAKGFTKRVHRYSDKSLYDWDNTRIWELCLREQPWVSERPKPVLLFLAAGQAKRLQPFSGETPKALLKFGGLTLAERTIDEFIKYGIGEVVVSVGYLHEQIESHLGTERAGVPIRYVFNPDFETKDPWSSILLSRDYIHNRQCYLVAGDQLLSPKLIRELVNSPHLDCVPVDENPMLKLEEDTCFAAIGEREGLLDKIIWPFSEAEGRDDLLGETPFLFKLSQGGTEILIEFIDNGEVSSLNEVMKRLPMYYIINDFPWAHINTLEGLDYAQKVVFPKF